MQTVDALGATEEQKAAVEADWRKGVCLIYIRAIGDNAFSDFPQPRRTGVAARWNELGDFQQWLAPDPDQIEAFFQDENIDLAGEPADWLADYRHFLQTNEIRNLQK
jgi:hypothetical protein